MEKERSTMVEETYLRQHNANFHIMNDYLVFFGGYTVCEDSVSFFHITITHNDVNGISAI